MKLLDSAFSTSSLLLFEAILCSFVITYVAYTEIDWIAYMQEVRGFLEGERDYTKLKGDTGPLVYPAGFVYIYSALYYITGSGENIHLAQWIFAGLYLVTLFVVLRIYRKCGGIPTVCCLLLLVSKRIHSIYMLRLFNDCFAMLFLYVAVFLFIGRRWFFGSVLFSMAVSVKMNIFLFAPGLLAVFLKNFSVARTSLLIFVCAIVQCIVGAPFLASFPVQYVMKAFELSRVFTFKWTVNYRFMPVDVFVSPIFGAALLGMTLLSWIWIARHRWSRRRMATPSDIVLTLFESNMIGIIFSRTLHYQFYSWFFHQLPFLMWMSTPTMPLLLRLILFLAIEVSFNIYPSTNWSSSILMLSFLIIWCFLCFDREKTPATAAQVVARKKRSGEKAE